MILQWNRKGFQEVVERTGEGEGEGEGGEMGRWIWSVRDVVKAVAAKMGWDPEMSAVEGSSGSWKRGPLGAERTE
jgi:hypothetical protein